MNSSYPISSLEKLLCNCFLLRSEFYAESVLAEEIKFDLVISRTPS